MTTSLKDTVGSSYLKVKRIGAGGMGEVYEAIALSDPTKRFAIKFIRSKGNKSFEYLHRFHQEATLLSQLYHHHIISLREFGITKQAGSTNAKKSHPFYYMVMDYVQGIDLHKIIRSNGTKGLNLQFFFQIACQMASALDYTHSKNIIHRDVKPHNIMVEKTTGHSSSIHAQLLDYGVATLGEVTNYIGGDQSNPLDRVVGTPPYMAPEITTIKQEGCDHRLDLYSLGCVLYEVLRGQPPFRHENLMTLKYLHATQDPEDLLQIRKDIPRIVSRIIMKLLAKNPDDRYQTAFALYSDLLSVQKSIYTPVLIKSRQQHEIAELGINSNFRSLKRKLKLIGRAKELNQLITFYSQVTAKTSLGHISLVCGANGSGKSRLLSELKDYFVSRKVKFISSLFIKYNSQSSLQCLASGFDEYLLKVIRHAPLEAKDIKERLTQVIGDRIILLIDMIPSIRLFIEDGMQLQDDLKDGEAEVDIHLLAKAFTDFARCLISFDQPIVFIFDDVDFADKNSLQIINDFFNFNNSEQIYIVLSCHDGTHGPLKEHVRQFLETITKFHERYQKITLKPLTLQQTSQLVCQLLNVRYHGILPIASYLFQEYAGNLIYTIEKLRDLALHGEMTHNLKNKHWSYDINIVKTARRPLTEVDLFLTRLSLLDQETINIIEAASIYGMNFDKKVLAITGISSTKKLDRILNKLVGESIIKKTYANQSTDSYSFVHSHYRDVVLYYLDKDRKTGIHLATAIELSNKHVVGDDKMVFTITHHFKEGFRRKNPYIAIKRSIVSRAFYYAVKAGQIAKAMQTIQCSIVFYQFATNLMNHYLRREQMNPGDWEKVYFEYITLLLRERFYQKAIHILTTIFQNKLPIYRHGRCIHLLRENLLECYLVLLLRISEHSTIRQLTHHYLKELGVDFDDYNNKSSLRRGLTFDKLHYVTKIQSTIKSPTARLLEALKQPSITPAPRAILLLNYLYLSVHPHSESAQLCHKIAMDHIQPGRTKHHDLIKLLHHRIHILRDHKFDTTVDRLLASTAQIVASNTHPRLSALFALYLAYDHQFSKHPNYKRIHHFVVKQKHRHCYSLQDFNEIGHYYAADLTRLFLAEKFADIDHLLPMIRQHFSTRSPQFSYILLVLTHYYTYNHNKNKIHRTVLKIVANQNFYATHHAVIFLHLCNAYALLHSDEFENSSRAFIKATKLLMTDPKMSQYPGYQVDFLLFSLMAYPTYYEALSCRSFPLNTPYPLMIITCKARFSATYPLLLIMKAIQQISTAKSPSKKFYARIFAQWEHASGELAINGLKTTRKFFTTLLNKWQYATLHQEFAAISLLKILKETQNKRFIGMTLVVEHILTQHEIPFKPREQRTPVEHQPALFDEMISNLYLSWLIQFCRPQFFQLSPQDQLEISFKLFQDKFGAEDGFLIQSPQDGSVIVDKIFTQTEPSSALIAEIKARLGTPQTEIFPLIRATKSPALTKTIVSAPNLTAHIDKFAAPTVIHHPTMDATQMAEAESDDATLSLTSHEHCSTVTGCLIPLNLNQLPHLYLYIHNLSPQYRTDPVNACKEISLWGQLLSQIIPQCHQQHPDKLIPFKPAQLHLAPCKWLQLWHHAPNQQLHPTAWVFGHELKNHQYLLVHFDIKAPRAQVKSMVVIHQAAKMIWYHLQILLHHSETLHQHDLLEQLKNDFMYLIRTMDTATHEILNISGFMALMSQQHTQVYLFNNTTASTSIHHPREHLSQPIVLHRFQSQGSLLYRKFLTPTTSDAYLILSSPMQQHKAIQRARHKFKPNNTWNKLSPPKRTQYLAKTLPQLYPYSLIITATLLAQDNTQETEQPTTIATPLLSA